mgnify:CR=1 FL=1
MAVRRGTGVWTRLSIGLEVAGPVGLAALAAGILTWLSARPGLWARVDLTAEGRQTVDAGLAALLTTAPPALQPTVSAALCLLGENCDGQKRFIRDALEFAASRDDAQALLRGAVHALGLLASSGHDDALSMLLVRAAGAQESVRAPIALSVGMVALRQPETLLRVLDGATDRSSAIELVRDAFDMLAEDFEEERFYATVRRAYTNELIAQFAADKIVVKVGSSALVAAAEAKLRGQIPDRASIDEAMAAMFGAPDGAAIDVVALSCTHFPLLGAELAGAAPRPCLWVDSSAAIARRVRELAQPQAGAARAGRAAFTDAASITALQGAFWDRGFTTYSRVSSAPHFSLAPVGAV